MRERQREQEAAITERQTSINDLNFVQGLLPDIQSGKFNPAALAPSRRTALESYVDPTQLYPSVERRAGQVASEYLGKSKFEEIPDEQGILQAFQAAGIGEQEMEHPAIVNALNAIKARQESLRGFIPATKVESYDPTTAASRAKFVPNNQLGGMSVQTGPTPQQAGQNQLTQALSGELSPEMTSAKAEQTNTLNRQTMGSEAAKAGAISGAQANAQLPAQKNLFQFSQDMRQEDALELEGERQKNRMAVKLAELAPNNNSAYMLLERAKGLNAQLDDEGFMGRMATGIGSFLGTNTVARDLDDLADGAGILFAAALGNKGQVSEADKMAGKAYWPMSHQPKELRDRKLLRAEQLVTIGDRVQRELGPMAPPALKAQRVKQLFQEMERAAGLPVLVGDELYYADEALPAQAPEADFELDEQ